MRRFLNHIKTANTLILIFSEGDPVSIPVENTLYAKVEDLINSNRLGEIDDVLAGPSTQTLGKFTVQGDGRIVIGGKPLPPTLSNRLVQFVQRGIPTAPLEKFWENCMKNPDSLSITELYDFLETNHVPLTNDGCFVAYKAVNNDWTDCHTGKVLNKPGMTITMPRDEVDPDRRNQCSYGFHVGGYSYASTFGPKLLEVKVNPAKVVSVPEDYNWAKMRVHEYEVIRENPKTERKEQTYSGRRAPGTAKKVAKSGIRRLPADLKSVSVDGTGGVSLSFDILGRLFEKGQKVYAVVATARTRAVTIMAKRPDSKLVLAKELKVGENTRIYSTVLAAAQIDGSTVYTLAIQNGTLVIK